MEDELTWRRVDELTRRRGDGETMRNRRETARSVGLASRLLVTGLIVTGLIVTGLIATGLPVAHAASSAQPGVRSKAVVVLEELPVKGRAPMTGYDRSRFGVAWEDVDGNGCDTRSDMLTRDLVERVMRDRCVVLSGVLYPDPYTGRPMTYVRGKSVVDIDHVVALGNAWATGAQQLSYTQRERLSNDPLNLLAVSASANRQKRDGDAATWLPSNKRYRCSYVARQIAVKSKYRLWVTKAEKAAMQRILGACPGQRVPTDATLPDPAPFTGGSSSGSSSSSPSSASGSAVRYANCTAARAAGVTPIRKATDPTLYAANRHMDRDGDGVACE